MTIKWFGKSWGAPINKNCPQVAIPVGEHCIHCEQAIKETDTGIISANGPVAHLDCFLRELGLDRSPLAHDASKLVGPPNSDA